VEKSGQKLKIKPLFMSYFANLRIQRIVIHEIFKRNDDGTIVPLKYNSDLTLLDSIGLQTLQNRIVNALGDNSHSIEMDVVDSSAESSFQLGASLLKAENVEFVDISKRIAYKLAEAQNTRNIPGGVVLIFSGTTGLNNYATWGILKAEIHEGFIKENVSEALLLRYITDLLLTPQQRLYKLGMFIEIGRTDSDSPDRLPTDFKNYVYDHNMTRNETQHAAYYFYRDFLGCSYSPTDKKLTSDFYYETKNFIKSSELSDEEKGELNTALFTYMKVSQEQIIHVEEFADDFLPTEEIKQEYISYMESKSFPTHAVGKDLSYIRNKLKQRKLTFTSNVKIIAPADEFNQLVQIQPDRDNEHTLVKIKGSVETHD
jgi:nucleoid-associated protein YejK